MSKRDRLIMIVDRSGSMQPVAAEAANAINRFIETQQNGRRRCDFQLVQFDDEYQEVAMGNIDTEAKVYSLVPRGMTALFDAIGRTLCSEALSRWPKKKYKNNIAVIVTDGHENASQLWGGRQIRQLMSALEDDGWEFAFLASNLDAEQMARDLGTQESVFTTMQHTGQGMAAGFAMSSEYVKALRNHGDKARAEAELTVAKRRSSHVE